MKTQFVKQEDIRSGQVPQKWWVVDAEGIPLGRLASQVSSILRGKHKATYTPHIDMGDFVVVVNAEKIKLTGRKLQDKVYHRHTGYPGGLKSRTAQEALEKKPESLVELAVKRMMPRNALNRHSLHKLKVYAGPDHPHQAQTPEKLSLFAEA